MNVTRATVPALLAILLIGGCAAQKTQREQAKSEWNAARASVLVTLAKEQYTAGNLDKCKETIDSAMGMDPTNADLHVLSAKLAIEHGELEAAENSCELARKFAPKNAEADYLSGVIYQRWQRPQDALRCYTAASDKAPAELAYLLAEAEMLVATGQEIPALTLLQGKVQYFEHSGSIRDAVGQLLVRAGRFDEAVDTLQQASILAEEDNSIREHLALALLQDKKYPDAIPVLSRLTSQDAYAKRADLFAAIGDCQIKLGDGRNARAAYETAVRLDASSLPSWLGYGEAALLCGDLPRAELALKKALTLDPQSADAHLLVGYTKLREQSLPESLDAFKQAYALDRTDTVSLCMVGYVLGKTGQTEQAIKCYARALQIKPNDEMATRLMASASE